MFRIYNEDCIPGARKYISDEEVDLMICDPPFGISEASFDKHYNRKESNVLDGYVEAPEDYLEWTIQWLTEAKRILKPNGSMYLVSGYSKLYEILSAIRQVRMTEINHIIWKYNFGVYTKNKYVTSHYHILYLKKHEKANPTFNRECRFQGSQESYRDREDVWVINREFQPGKVKNKNKLPTKLVGKMVQYSSNPDDIICDFFLGNFTTAYVAVATKRIPIGFEKNSNGFKNKMSSLRAMAGADLYA